MFNTIWKPIIANSDDVKTIYFSPAGELYNLPIEYANCTDNHTIGEKYIIYRLSSTREIVISREEEFFYIDKNTFELKKMYCHNYISRYTLLFDYSKESINIPEELL